MEFYGMRGRDLILRKFRNQIKSSYSFEVHFNKEKIYLRKLHERPFCMNHFLLHEFVLFLPPHKLHCFMPSIYNCCAACTKYYSNKNEGYDTQNQQIYSSKGGPNVMERLRVCGMLFLVNLNNLKGKAAMNRLYCMEELTFLSSVKGGNQLWLGWELLVCWCIGQFSIFCWPSISFYFTYGYGG